jgi:hypothetical protein
MKAFKNIFGTQIENKPFYHTACKVWRVARFENNELDTVNENVGYKSYEECLIECNK